MLARGCEDDVVLTARRNISDIKDSVWLTTAWECRLDSILLDTGKFQLLKIKTARSLGRILCRADLVRTLRAIFSSI